MGRRQENSGPKGLGQQPVKQGMQLSVDSITITKGDDDAEEERTGIHEVDETLLFNARNRRKTVGILEGTPF